MRRQILVIVASIALLAIAFFINRNGIPGPSPFQQPVDMLIEQREINEQKEYEKLKQDLELIEAEKKEALEKTSDDAHVEEKDLLVEEK